MKPQTAYFSLRNLWLKYPKSKIITWLSIIIKQNFKNCSLVYAILKENIGGYFMDRFKKVYRQGVLEKLEVWVDTETGVNYLFKANGYAGGLTALLDKDGKPVITYNGKDDL